MVNQHHGQIVIVCAILKALQVAIDFLVYMGPANNKEKGTEEFRIFTEKVNHFASDMVITHDLSLIDNETVLKAKTVVDYSNLNKTVMADYQIEAGETYDDSILRIVSHGKEILLSD